ncbi:SRF-3 protein, partial [Aphelenchoides avenae]
MGIAQPEKELLIADGLAAQRALEAAYCAKPPLQRENSRQRSGTSSSVDIKVAVLIWLALQNSVHTLVLRYSRARDVQEMYFPSVAVFLTEIFKVLFCVQMITWESKGPLAALHKIKTQVINEPRDTIKVCIPSMLYILQNNLFYVAASHLDAATFM